jgi:RimJ/RimL family protein N-acetyltransferase
VNIKVFIRNADVKDAQKIFEWRNDPATRQASMSSELITWDEHEQWYYSALKNKDLLITICDILDDKLRVAIAMVKFELNPIDQSSVISINMDPKARGKSLGQSCLNEAIDYMHSLNQNYKKIIATIKQDNIASQKAFEKAGFKRLDIHSQTTTLQYFYELNNE